MREGMRESMREGFMSMACAEGSRLVTDFSCYAQPMRKRSARWSSRVACALSIPAVLAATCAINACSSKDESGFDHVDGGGGGGGGLLGGGEGGGPSFGGEGGNPNGDTDAATDGCPPSATLVYVTGQGDKLYSFYPPDQTFTLIGKFSCLTNPTHMTVDRQGNAWVVAGGQIYKASTADASCTAASTWKPNISYSDFSLTFVGITNNVDNTLFVLNNSSKLSSFDIGSGALTNIGNVSTSATLGDMTSNGDGTLYFLKDVSTPVLYNFSPADASTIGSNPLQATGGGSQALAFWGGRFYAFESSDIHEYDPMMKSTKKIGTAPLSVTGAGQSTCVPKVPPTTK